VVSTGAQRRIVWVSAPGDYATFNSNHTPDGTCVQVLAPHISFYRPLLIARGDNAATRRWFPACVNAVDREGSARSTPIRYRR
jgi:hypothetical protein